MPKHPAKYSDALLPIFKDLLVGYEKVLDPFAGTGKLRSVRPDAFLLEIEPEWAAINNATVGDALNMPWGDSEFDAICTSPTYGNRMADNFTDYQTGKKYKRNTYRHALGRKPNPNNSGILQWGDRYREFHVNAWKEVHRVLRPGGRFILNISDHIRNGIRQYVTGWHLETLLEMGFVLENHIEVKTPRNRMGQNATARVDHESVLVFKKT